MNNQNQGSGTCPTCGRNVTTPWDKDGRCITCTRDEVLGIQPTDKPEWGKHIDKGPGATHSAEDDCDPGNKLQSVTDSPETYSTGEAKRYGMSFYKQIGREDKPQEDELPDKIRSITRAWLDHFEDLQPWEDGPIEDEVWQEIIDAHLKLIQESNRKAVEAAYESFQTVAIPETTDYANGWNDCRKWVRTELNRLATLKENQQ